MALKASSCCTHLPQPLPSVDKRLYPRGDAVGHCNVFDKYRHFFYYLYSMHLMTQMDPLHRRVAGVTSTLEINASRGKGVMWWEHSRAGRLQSAWLCYWYCHYDVSHGPISNISSHRDAWSYNPSFVALLGMVDFLCMYIGLGLCAWTNANIIA